MSDEKKLDMVILKDTAVFSGWIAGLLLIAGLCWALTLPVRSRFMVRAVNRVLEQSGDYRRLGELSSSGGAGSIAMGAWYTMTQTRRAGEGGNESFNESFAEGTKAFVFTFIGEGTFFPCAAVIEEGRVREFLPLNSHGERILKNISPGILRLYARRIEGSGS